MTSFSPSQKTRIALIFVITGLWGAQFSFIPFEVCVFSIFCLFLFLIWKHHFWIFIGLFFLAFGYAHWRTPEVQTDPLSKFQNKMVILEGFVVDFPEIKQNHQNLFLTVTTLNKKPLTKASKILIKTKKEAQFLYGTQLKVVGKIKKPQNFNGFNYVQYLQKFGVNYLLNQPALEEIPGTSGSWMILQAHKARALLANNLDRALPEPHETIALGVLLGVKKVLPPRIEKNFKNAGLQHLLVVSGTNVTLLLFFIAFLLKPFGKWVLFGGSLFILLFFVSMTGAEAPVLRAALLGILILLAMVFGRLTHIRNFILMSAVLMGIYQPLLLQSDVSTFLSFSATLGMILGVPVLWKYTPFITQKYGIRLLTSATLAAQIGVLPVLGYTFGHFPLNGFITNIIVEPFMILIMGTALITSFLAIFDGLWASIIGLTPFILIEGLLQIARIFGNSGVIEVSKNVSLIIGTFVYSFFLWALLSPLYEEKFLEPFEKSLKN